MPHNNPANYQLTNKGRRALRIEKGADLPETWYEVLTSIEENQTEDLPAILSFSDISAVLSELEREDYIRQERRALYL